MEGAQEDLAGRGGVRAVYLDANATTPVHPRVAETIEPFLRAHFGNPSSSHPEGRRAAEAVARGRRQLAGLLGCTPEEIVFTAGGSESDNLALKGIAWRCRDRGRHLVVSAVEHPAVLAPARFLQREGWRVTVLPVDSDGRVDPATVAASLRDDTVLVSIMHANNETGALNPLPAIAAVCRERGVLLHTDASQSVGKVPTRVTDLGVDLLSLTGHKFYAPKGIGALYVRAGVELEPLVHGAGHESGRRAGTENVAYIAGLGAAAEWAVREGLAVMAGPVRRLRDRLHELLAAGIPGLRLNGPVEERLPNTLNAGLPDVSGRAVLEAASGVEASTGAACHEGYDEPSGVLLAMGLNPEAALGAVRLSLTAFTAAEEIERAAAELVQAWSSVRRR